MTGLTQKEMAKKLSISEGTYRNKEKGRAEFSCSEMETFFDLVRKEVETITINEIFFGNRPT